MNDSISKNSQHLFNQLVESLQNARWRNDRDVHSSYVTLDGVKVEYHMFEYDSETWDEGMQILMTPHSLDCTITFIDRRIDEYLPVSTLEAIMILESFA